MGYYCFNADGYSHIADEYDSGESPSMEKKSRFWQWGWGWISAKKACFCRDLAMGEDEMMLGCGRVSWRHLFWKLRAEFRKMIKSRPSHRFKYDALSYAQNFDDGCWQDPDDHHFACRFHSNMDPFRMVKPRS
eukprot:Gb_32476 [translate_table: standard]